MICYMIRHEDKSLWAARHQPGCLGLQISSTHGLGLEVWGWAEKHETMLPGQGYWLWALQNMLLLIFVGTF